MKHVRIFVNLFGFKYCIKGFDVAESAVGPIVAGAAVLLAHVPELTLEVTDHA